MSQHRMRSPGRESYSVRDSRTMRGSVLRELSRNDDILISEISSKLKRNRVKASTVISLCEEMDLNGDNYIHIGDLEAVLIQVLGRGSVSQRQMHDLAPLLDERKGSINYMKFLGIFSEAMDLESEKTHERWMDTQQGDGKEGEPGDQRDRYTSWATKRGSVGEFLQKAACPAEIKNFRRFIACLEEYERKSGCKCIHKDDGFIVPMGPDLKASISFFMR